MILEKKIKPQEPNITSKCNIEGKIIDSSHVQPKVKNNIPVDTASIFPAPSPTQTRTIPTSTPITHIEVQSIHTLSHASPPIIPPSLPTITHS